MTKLTFAFVSIWASLLLAAASRGAGSRMHGEWLKLALRIAQQPLPVDLLHAFALFDPHGHWLTATQTLAA